MLQSNIHKKDGVNDFFGELGQEMKIAHEEGRRAATPADQAI